jgi:3-hydroxybutyryl-CoA dehydratase
MAVKFPEVGQSAKSSMTITDDAIREFARLSGDDNPIHLDSDYAARTRFGRRIAHGVFTAGLISRVAGTQLPGPGSIYLNQTMKFKAPAYIGDTVTAEIKVLHVKPEKALISLSTVVRNQRDEVLLEGEALVLYDPV